MQYHLYWVSINIYLLCCRPSLLLVSFHVPKIPTYVSIFFSFVTKILKIFLVFRLVLHAPLASLHLIWHCSVKSIKYKKMHSARPSASPTVLRKNILLRDPSSVLWSLFCILPQSGRPNFTATYCNTIAILGQYLEIGHYHPLLFLFLIYQTPFDTNLSGI
jgi:hypothetical protein